MPLIRRRTNLGRRTRNATNQMNYRSNRTAQEREDRKQLERIRLRQTREARHSTDNGASFCYDMSIDYSDYNCVAIGPMNSVCQYCKALKYKKEADGLCCGNGKLPEDSLLRPIRMEPVPIDDRRHECTICHRKFKRRQHLKVHYNVHSKEQPNIWCSVCSQGFTLNSQFEAHDCPGSSEEIQQEEVNVGGNEAGVTLLDAKKENEYPLEILPLEEPQHQPFQYIHDESAIPVPKIVYVCKYCNKPFKRKDHYKIHLHIHTGVKSFFCPECGKGFYRKDHLQKHLQVHTKPKPKPKKAVPDLFPINMLQKKKEVKPEITIHAPSNTKLRVPLQIKVPYQMVMSLDNGEQSAFTVDPQSSTTQYDNDT